MSASIKAVYFLQENKNAKSQEGNEFNVEQINLSAEGESTHTVSSVLT